MYNLLNTYNLYIKFLTVYIYAKIMKLYKQFFCGVCYNLIGGFRSSIYYNIYFHPDVCTMLCTVCSVNYCIHNQNYIVGRHTKKKKLTRLTKIKCNVIKKNFQEQCI